MKIVSLLFSCCCASVFYSVALRHSHLVLNFLSCARRDWPQLRTTDTIHFILCTQSMYTELRIYPYKQTRTRRPTRPTAPVVNRATWCAYTQAERWSPLVPKFIFPSLFLWPFSGSFYLPLSGGTLVEFPPFCVSTRIKHMTQQYALRVTLAPFSLSVSASDRFTPAVADDVANKTKQKRKESCVKPKRERGGW